MFFAINLGIRQISGSVRKLSLTVCVCRRTDRKASHTEWKALPHAIPDCSKSSHTHTATFYKHLNSNSLMPLCLFFKHFFCLDGDQIILFLDCCLELVQSSPGLAVNESGLNVLSSVYRTAMSHICLVYLLEITMYNLPGYYFKGFQNKSYSV